jgi:hypothetical protein
LAAPVRRANYRGIPRALRVDKMIASTLIFLTGRENAEA